MRMKLNRRGWNWEGRGEVVKVQGKCGVGGPVLSL